MIVSPRKKFIVYLDSTLFVIFILLLSPRLTGILVHEVLGFIFFIPLIIHLIIAWPWIRAATGKFFKTASRRTRFNFFLNTLLFILMITELVSGFMISQEVLPWFGIHRIMDKAWRATHNFPLNFVMLVTGLHIAINWRWIVAAFKKHKHPPKAVKRSGPPRFISILKRIVIIILAAGLVAVLLYYFVGGSSLMRWLDEDENERFDPTVGHGLLQLFGEAFLVAVVAFVGRKWLRIRL